jgi:hypothetical protein
LSINAKASHLELIRLWIDRSGVQPLRFSINCAHLSGAACESLLEVFLAHRDRWAHMELGSNKLGIRTSIQCKNETTEVRKSSG